MRISDWSSDVCSSDLVPGQTGIYAPRGQSADRIKEVWLTAPSRSRATITRRLAVSFTEVATGTEIYRAHVNEVIRTERSDDGMRLVDALATSLPSDKQNANQRSEADT